MVIISVGRSSFPVCPWPQCSLWGALGRTKLHNPQYRVLCLTCWENNHKNGGARINEASKVCVAFGPAELLCFEDLSPKLSVQGIDFKANIFSFFLKLGLQWQRESIHRHTGPHDQHREWFLADGLAGGQSRDCYDHKTQGKKWGMTFSQVQNIVFFLLL